MEMITIKNLTKNYAGVHALKGISFSINKGEIFGFLGPNGAGKTTTIHCICQLATPTSGKITVAGHDIKKEYLEAKKAIGLSAQEFGFDMYFPILDTLVYQGGYFGLKKKEALLRAQELLQEFGLWEKRKAMFKELSGGMKRKLSIAKALMHKPSILILDEPTAGLDVDSRYDLWEFIKNLQKKGMTIILTTHYIEEAEKLCNRIGIINKGKIIKITETKKIIDELSQNTIRFYLANPSFLPKEVENYEHTFKDGQLKIFVRKKEQTAVLNKLLATFSKEHIEVINFTIEEDNLENIFRRLING